YDLPYEVFSFQCSTFSFHWKIPMPENKKPRMNANSHELRCACPALTRARVPRFHEPFSVISAASCKNFSPFTFDSCPLAFIRGFRASDFGFLSGFGIRHSGFPSLNTEHRT